MQLDRRLVMPVIALLCLAYAPSAIGGNNPGPIHINGPAQAPASAGNDSSKTLGEFPASAPCDLTRLTETLNGFLGQKAALEQELAHREDLMKTAQASNSPEAVPERMMIAAQIEDLQHRITALENRELLVRNQIYVCKGHADDPAPGNEPPPPGGSGSNGASAPGIAAAPKFHSDEDLTAGMRISCKVPKGDETRTIVFRNIGQKQIPAGTPVTWYVRSFGQGGQFFMPRALDVGADLTANNLLKLAVPGPANCRSKL